MNRRRRAPTCDGDRRPIAPWDFVLLAVGWLWYGDRWKANGMGNWGFKRGLSPFQSGLLIPYSGAASPQLALESKQVEIVAGAAD